MKQDDRDELDQQIALFRYGVINDLIHLPRGPGSGLYDKLRNKAEQTYDIPGSDRTRVAAETARSWLAIYRRDGFDGLRPAKRSDKGSCRSLPQQVIDLLITIKEEHPDYTVPRVIEVARQNDEFPDDLDIHRSTVYRHLKRAGVMDKRPEQGSSKDQRRFSFERADELWMSDVMHGPAVRTDGRRKRKTYLIAFIDDATRVVPFATFAMSEKTEPFLTALKEAISRRGIPQRLYVDNGAAYRSRHLAVICARLGITLIHARPYHAAGKGKIERWFRTVRMQLLPTLGEADLDSLDSLNRRLWPWVEGEYHQAPHRGLDGMTPFDAWAMRSDEVRIPGPETDLRELFLFEVKRRVQRDRTVSLKGKVYEVDATLVGETVVLRYDPYKPGETVDVWHRGNKVQTAKVVDVYANCFVRRNHDSKNLEPSRGPDEPAQGLALASLRDGKEAD
jgi:transposase InsO family protein